MEKPQYLSGWLDKKGEKGILQSFQLRYFQQDGKYLYYYEDNHFQNTADSKGHIDLSSITAVEGVASTSKKEKSLLIQISTRTGRSFVLREPKDDPAKAQEWLTRIDEWRKWLKVRHLAEEPNSAIACFCSYCNCLSSSTQLSPPVFLKGVLASNCDSTKKRKIGF
jgi:hypothetical protein